MASKLLTEEDEFNEFEPKKYVTK